MRAKAKAKSRKLGGRIWWTAIGFGAAAAATGVAAKTYGEWSPSVSAEQGSNPELNTVFNDGCPILSPDGLSLYMASNRPGGLGGQDIWVAHRANTTDGWGAPVNLGAPVNSAADDFCPSPVRGKRLFFVSKRTEPNGDIYVTRLGPDGWQQPTHLGPNVNSPAEEWSPSYFEDEAGREVLYFSRNTPGTNTHDIYYSVDFGLAEPAPGINSALSEARPNVRRDGLEIVFDSNRAGGLGGQDIWTASRSSTSQPWSAPIHLGSISSAANDTRASLSWDGTFMLFGSARAGGEGQADIYVTTRSKVTGADD